MKRGLLSIHSCWSYRRHTAKSVKTKLLGAQATAPVVPCSHDNLTGLVTSSAGVLFETAGFTAATLSLCDRIWSKKLQESIHEFCFWDVFAAVGDSHS